MDVRHETSITINNLNEVFCTVVPRWNCTHSKAGGGFRLVVGDYEFDVRTHDDAVQHRLLELILRNVSDALLELAPVPDRLAEDVAKAVTP